MNEEQLLALSRQLLSTIVSKRTSVQLKYKYYEAEQEVRDLGISMPVRLLMLQSGLGWASKAVDVIADLGDSPNFNAHNQTPVISAKSSASRSNVSANWTICRISSASSGGAASVDAPIRM